MYCLTPYPPVMFHVKHSTTAHKQVNINLVFNNRNNNLRQYYYSTTERLYMSFVLYSYTVLFKKKKQHYYSSLRNEAYEILKNST